MLRLSLACSEFIYLLLPLRHLNLSTNHKFANPYIFTTIHVPNPTFQTIWFKDFFVVIAAQERLVRKHRLDVSHKSDLNIYTRSLSFYHKAEHCTLTKFTEYSNPFAKSFSPSSRANTKRKNRYLNHPKILGYILIWNQPDNSNIHVR